MPTPHIKLALFTDIFQAPPNSILIHACNARGIWGNGVAAAFKREYPHAYKKYQSWCLEALNQEKMESRVGQCLLIPPSPSFKTHWIACLITSYDYGRKRDSVGKVLHATASALDDLANQIAVLGSMDVYAVKINSGLFRVEWGNTLEVLRQGRVDLSIVCTDENEDEDLYDGGVPGKD